MERPINRKLSRRQLLKLSGMTLLGTPLAAACGPSATAPQASGATAVAEATAVSATAVPATVVAEQAQALLPPELMPGSPNHPNGWATKLPPLPRGVPYQPPITLTASRNVNASMVFAEGDSIENSPFTRMIKQLFGIEWKVGFTFTDTDDAGQKYNLALASGDLPDLMEGLPLPVYQQMLQAGLLEDITEVWEREADPDAVKQPLEYGDGLAWSYAAVNGRKMGIPVVEAAAQNDKLLWIREDWLEKVGLEVPTTLDELAVVAKAFAEANLGQGAPGTTVGLNAAMEYNTWYSSLDPVFGAFGVIPGFWSEEGAGLVYDSTRPEMKEALALLRTWYADGVIPADFFTVSTADSANVVGGNRTGLHFSPFFAPLFGIKDSITNDPSARWIFADVPVGPSGRRGKAWSNPYPASVFAFRKGFPHVDAVIKQTNWLAQLVQAPANRYHGWENRDYAWEGDVVVAGPLGSNGSTKQFFGPVGSNANNRTDPLYLQKQYQLEEEWAKLPVEQRDAYQIFATEDPSGLQPLARRSYLFATERSEQDGIKNRFTALPTPAMSTLGTEMTRLEQEAFIAIIKGDKDIDAFDAFVASWKQVGGDKVTEEVNAWWQSRR